ncbi:MAG: hypothetical protein JO201_09150 [Verrucomicrobia bacterium]|nr:hypothetical protein [Verrucomicrobiota bacterium]
MNSQRTGLRVASAIFALVAIIHIVRLINHFAVQIGGQIIPLGASWVFVIVFAFLCIWMWRLSSRAV